MKGMMRFLALPSDHSIVWLLLGVANRMRVADGDGRSVSRIVRSRNRGEVEQQTHHLTYLLLFCGTVAGHGELHFVGRIFRNRETAVGQCQHGHSTGLSNSYRRTHILAEEEFLYRGLLRAIAAHQLAELVVDLLQPWCQGKTCGRSDDVASDHPERIALCLHHCIAHNRDTRVDAQDDPTRGTWLMNTRHIYLLVQTRSLVSISLTRLPRSLSFVLTLCRICVALLSAFFAVEH